MITHSINYSPKLTVI
ncbi:CRISPR-associated DxTHG motif protein [Lentilactobacillus hilgardii]|nr:CRISPR-associated DxTHG motif protein [Lentilactobacillus hilgardii]